MVGLNTGAMLLAFLASWSPCLLGDEPIVFETDDEDCLEAGSLALLQRRGVQLHGTGNISDRSFEEMLGYSPSDWSHKLMKGISYGPSPLTEAGKLPFDDFFCDDAKPLWSNPGRRDLEIMKELGANTVRLYGNDPSLEHDEFLNTAKLLGLGVIPGNGDAAFYGKPCHGSGAYNCSEGVQEAYKMNLRKGFLRRSWKANSNLYHKAIEYMLIVNEPELKFPNLQSPRSFARAIATAFDGMLSAEDEADIIGPRPNFTATFSFASCPQCEKHGNHPGLGQMWTFQQAMLNPEKYGITPKHNLTEAFFTRFTFSFNSGNPADEIKRLFLDLYEEVFPSTPIFIGEYHNPGNSNLAADLSKILSIAAKSPLLLGISFFEWQNRYDEEGHLVWGMFDPQPFSKQVDADRLMIRVRVKGKSIKVPCLSPVFDSNAHKSVPDQIAEAYGGTGLTKNELLCQPRSDEVLISEHGFSQMLGLKNATVMGEFIARTVDHMGGWAPDGVPESVSRVFINPYATWQSLLAILDGRPAWAKWDSSGSACIADKNSLKSEVGKTISYVCSLGYAPCDKVPEECKRDVWDTANWVFGSHFRVKSFAEDQRFPQPLTDCFFHGVAKFVRPSLVNTFHNNTASCVVPFGKPRANEVHVSFNGFNTIQGSGDPVVMSSFIERVVSHMGGYVRAGAMPVGFAMRFLAANASFRLLTAELEEKPDWIRWISRPACVPDGGARASDVGNRIGQVCGEGLIDCGKVPVSCKGGVRDTAAWVFGNHYKAILQRDLKQNKTSHPLEDCYIGGNARLIDPSEHLLRSLREECVIPADTTTF